MWPDRKNKRASYPGIPCQLDNEIVLYGQEIWAKTKKNDIGEMGYGFVHGQGCG